jgi:hypothetical protein
MLPLLILITAVLAANASTRGPDLPAPNGRMLLFGPRVRIESSTGEVLAGRMRWLRPDTLSLSSRGAVVSVPVSRITRIDVETRPWAKRAVKGAVIGAVVDLALLGWGIYYDTHETDTYGSGTFGAIAAFPVLTIGGGSIGFLTRPHIWVPAQKPEPFFP